MFKDWCPLCGARFQAETMEQLAKEIVEHTKEDEDGESECSRNFKPLSEALKDDHY